MSISRALASCLFVRFAVVVAALVALTGRAAAQEQLQLPSVGSATWDQLVEWSQNAGPEAGRTPNDRGPAPLPREIGLPQGGTAPSTGNGGGYGPRACPSLGVVPTASPIFQGLDDNNGSIPPDTMGAVGPTYVMTTLNTEVRITDKSGVQQSRVSLNAFFAIPGGSNFDPLVHFDPLSQRWFFLTCVDARVATSSINLAVSRTNDPRGTWDFYRIDADSTNVNWCDYARMGMNDTWVAISGNMFPNAGGGGVGSKMWVISKTSALSNGGALTLTTFPLGFDIAGGFGGFTLQPAKYMESSPSTLFIVDSSGLTSGGTVLLRLSRITGTAAAPVWSVVPGSSFAGTGLFPVNTNFDLNIPLAPQSGSATLIDAGDSRMQSVMFRNGKLWCAAGGGLPVGAPTRGVAVWYQLNTVIPGTIAQQGIVDGGANVWYTYPSIAANCGDDAVIGFSRCTTTTFPSAAYTTRLAADAAGTMRPVVVYQAGLASYVKLFSGTRNRWGDYTSTVIDPSDDLTFWTLQESSALPSGGFDRWNVSWARIAGCSFPSITSQPSGGAICPGASVSLSVLATGPGTLTYQWRNGLVNLTNGGQFSNVTTPTMTITGYAAGNNGNYNCVVTNSCGSTTSNDATLSLATGAPSAPVGLVATDRTVCASVNLTWTATAGATGYQVFRNTSNNSATATLLGSPAVASFSDTTAVGGTNYFFWVKATNPCGTSGFSAVDAGARAIVPAAPTSVSATDFTSCIAIIAAWTGNVNATSYKVYRNTVNNFATATLVGSTAGTTFTDTTPPSGVPVFYFIVGSSVCGDSAPSLPDQGSRTAAVVYTTQPAPSQTVVAGNSVSFTVAVTGTSPTYQWRKGVTVLTNGGSFSGVSTPTFAINPVAVANAGNYNCVVTNGCGSVVSATGVLIVTTCPCSADFDNSGGAPDAGDIDAFFIAWLNGDPTADVDCSGGVPDAGDIDVFFAQWLAGGC